MAEEIAAAAETTDPIPPAHEEPQVDIHKPHASKSWKFIELCKVWSILLGFVLLFPARAMAEPLSPVTPDGDSHLSVILLGTMIGPTFSAQRLGISTLIVAGREKLLFDCGRAMTTGMAALGIKPMDVTKVFLTHLHSDHVIALPELYLYAWVQGRTTPLQVWGPEGTQEMMKNLQEAFKFDIHIRRDVDEKFPAEGIKAVATDIHQGVVYEANGVKVTAFLVDHGPVKPAFGYRIDYRGHSVVLSGDTKPSDNLVKFSQGADLLLHELGRFKQDPQLDGVARIIANHHTDGLEAGQIFQRVQPKLAVFTHYGAVQTGPTLALVRQNYAGPVEFGEDLMTIDIGDTVSIHKFVPPAK